jgi:hypothetical protein
MSENTPQKALHELARKHRVRSEMLGEPQLPKAAQSGGGWVTAKETAQSILSTLTEQKFAEQSIARSERYLDLLMDSAPTDTRTPMEYWVWAKNQGSIDFAAASLGRSVPPLLVVDTMRIVDWNAWAGQIENSDEYLIILQTGLRDFTNIICKPLARIVVRLGEKLRQLAGETEATRKFLHRHLGPDADALDDLTRVFSSYLFGGNVLSAPIGYDKTPELRMISGALETAANLFVLGHEYGHVLQGHLFPSGRDDNWEMEFSADQIALELMLESHERYRPVIPSFCGAAVLMTAWDVLYRCERFVDDETAAKSIPSLHPPIADRFERLCANLRERRSSDPTVELELSAGLKAVVECSLQPMKDLISQKMSSGWRPHAQWRQRDALRFA